MPKGDSFSAPYAKFNVGMSIHSNSRSIIFLDKQFQKEVDIMK